MSNTVLIVLVLSVVSGLIYFLYTIILDTNKKPAGPELQISAEDVLEQVQILYKQKKYAIIENLATKYLEKNPKHLELRIVLAKTLFDDMRYERAIIQALSILKQAPQNLNIRILLANAYKNTAQASLAISELQEVLKISENNLPAMRALATILYDTNQKQSALNMFIKLDELVENNLEKLKIESIIAQLHLELNHINEAIAQYKAILEIYPENPDIKKKLIEIYERTENEGGAIEMCADILNHNTDNSEEVWALDKLVALYTKINNLEKALEYANRLLKVPTADKVMAQEHIANIYFIQGKKDDSIHLLMELALQNPKNIQLREKLADAYIGKENFQAAITIYKEILDLAQPQEVPEIHNKISNIYAEWAVWLYKQDESDECFKKFDIALQYNSENPDVYLKVAQVNEIIKNYNEAILLYKKVLEFSPGRTQIYLALANCYQEINNVYEAKRVLLDAVKCDENNSLANYKLGLLAMEQHDLNNAKNYFKRTTELDNECLDAKYRLALILESQGHKDEAIELYQQILDQDPEFENAQENIKMLKSTM